MKLIFLWTMQHTGTISMCHFINSCSNCMTFKYGSENEQLRNEITQYVESGLQIPLSLLSNIDSPFLLIKMHLLPHSPVTEALIANQAISVITLRNPLNVLLSYVKRNEPTPLNKFIQTYHKIKSLSDMLYLLPVDGDKQYKKQVLSKFVSEVGLVYSQQTVDWMNNFPILNSVEKEVKCFSLLSKFSKIIRQDKLLYPWLRCYYTEEELAII